MLKFYATILVDGLRLFGLLETINMLSFKRVLGLLYTKKIAILLSYHILCGTVKGSFEK